MYNNLPSWITQPCPREYGYNLEPEEIKKRVDEAIKNNDDLLANLRYGDSFCIHVDKRPFAKTNDIRTFTTFTEAKKLLAKAQQTYKGKNVGLGFGFFGPFCGIDIDHCINEEGVISDTASKIIDMFDGAYIETSLSGTGVHIIFHMLTKYQKKYQKYFTKMSEEACKANGFSDIKSLEFYQGRVDDRFFTMTGNYISRGKDNNHTFGKEKIEKFLETFMSKPQPKTPAAPPVEFDSSDDEDKAWIKWALQVRKPQDLITAWFRTATGSGGTESEDDLDFCRVLAFYCNKNKEVMRAIFEASPYFKSKDQEHLDKWNNREDYRNKYCLDKAIDNQQDVAKNYFKDSFYYDEESKTIKSTKGGDTMVKIYKLIKKDGTVVPDVYNFRENNISYTVTVAISKAGELYCKKISAYDHDTKSKLGNIDARKLDEQGKEIYNSEFFRLQNKFLDSYRNSDLD